MNIRNGSAVTWTSAAGKLSGIVKDIILDYNASNKIVPWIIVKRFDTDTSVMLCGTGSNLKAMKVKLIEEETV